MWLRARAPLALLVAAVISQGCVSVHAPLKADEKFPSAWGQVTTLGAECTALNGTYLNQGVVTTSDGSHENVSLTSVLNIRSNAHVVSLDVHTRKVDQNGDAFITLHITPDNDISAIKEHEGCFCLKGTLACTQVSEKYWTFPNLGFGGSQSNVYFAINNDHALIAKLQNYHADIILAIPFWGMQEPWVKFDRANP